MNLESIIQDTLGFACEVLREQHTDTESCEGVIDRLSVRNRFWPSQVFVRTCADLSGDLSINMIPKAAAIELLHVSTLVHDDIIDEHDSRWNMPSLRKLWGTGAALLWGEVLSTTAAKVLLTTGDTISPVTTVGIALRHWQRIISGQLLDLRHSSHPTISWGQYSEVGRLKTSIGGLAVELGAHAAACSNQETASLLEFAESAGLSSQISNDFSELYEVRGFVKPYRQDSNRGGEIALGRKTIFHVFYHTRENQNRRVLESLNTCDRPGELIPELTKTGASRFSVETYARLVQKASLALNKLHGPMPLLSEYLRTANALPATVEGY